MPMPSVDIEVDSILDLTLEDLEDKVQLPASRGSTMGGGIKRIRAAHHRIALLLAFGYKQVEVAKMTGYSSNYISELLHDPSFADLLKSYQSQAIEIETDTFKQLSLLTVDSIAEVHERLLQQPEAFTNKDLLDLIKTAADRSGHGPTSTKVSLQGEIPPDELKKIREAASQRQKGTVSTVEGDYKEIGEASDNQASGNPGDVCGQTPLLEAPEEDGEASESGNSVREEGPGLLDQNVSDLQSEEGTNRRKPLVTPL